jgi:nucleoside-triphosphate--adenylate kinase
LQGRDDITGEPLSQRVDDQPVNVKRRLEVYSTTTQPVIDFYKENGVLKDFKGRESNKIWPEVFKSLATFIKPKMPLP